jgi:hypothetical protein
MLFEYFQLKLKSLDIASKNLNMKKIVLFFKRIFTDISLHFDVSAIVIRNDLNG